MRKKLKGFTLVELILVMAIFGILMAAIMSIITPLNKISKRASLTEANVAAVDNIKTYLESSLRYSECVEVCSGGLTDNTGKLFGDYTDEEFKTSFGVTDVATTDEEKEDRCEKAAIINYIDNHYTNRVKAQDTKKSNYSPDKPLESYNPNSDPEQLTGKVRLLKIDNANGGRITETEYTFTAGYTYTQYLADGTADTKLRRVNATVDKGSDTDVINPVYLENYSFYIQPGYNEMVTVDVDDNNSDFDTNGDAGDVYYAALKPVDDTVSNFTSRLFSLSVVTYKNDTKVDGTDTVPEYRGEYKESDTKSYTAFKSPFAITNTNMSLVNIFSEFAKDKKSAERYGPVRYSGKPQGTDTEYTPTTKVSGTGGAWLYEVINTTQSPKLNDNLFVHSTVPADKNDDCIYFIYTLPDLV